MPETSDLEALKAILRGRGLSATAARLSVLQVLRDGHEHRTAAEIRTDVLLRYPAIDPATIYRTLERLEEHGLAIRVVTGDTAVRWAHVTDNHHHLVCRRCGSIMELGPTPFHHLAAEIAAEDGHHVEVQHVVLHGLCSDCASKESA
ncbi:MAG TPA: Fur family transcriptional regulator [Chloroflexota bacterium]|jgi:Fur family ferric uptake transcriptional regulator|nr:Fur family transcriptional regulator [Chloroflexota bacterium]